MISIAGTITDNMRINTAGALLLTTTTTTPSASCCRLPAASLPLSRPIQQHLSRPMGMPAGTLKSTNGLQCLVWCGQRPGLQERAVIAFGALLPRFPGSATGWTPRSVMSRLPMQHKTAASNISRWAGWNNKRSEIFIRPGHGSLGRLLLLALPTSPRSFMEWALRVAMCLHLTKAKHPCMHYGLEE